MEQAINEALKNKEITIWLQEYLDDPVDGDYAYTANLYSPFERLLKRESAISLNDKQAGHVFYAYISLDNDEKILKQHGRIELCERSSLPNLIEYEWQGAWFDVDVNLSGKRDGLSNGKKITISSEIGEIPEDGCDYLIFVLLMKKIMNSGFSLSQKREWVEVAYKTSGQGGEEFRKYLSFIGKDIDEVMSKF